VKWARGGGEPAVGSSRAETCASGAQGATLCHSANGHPLSKFPLRLESFICCAVAAPGTCSRMICLMAIAAWAHPRTDLCDGRASDGPTTIRVPDGDTAVRRLTGVTSTVRMGSSRAPSWNTWWRQRQQPCCTACALYDRSIRGLTRRIDAGSARHVRLLLETPIGTSCMFHEWRSRHGQRA
jgi:hypothetical protein